MNGRRAKLIRRRIFNDKADKRHYQCLESNKTTAFLSRTDLRVAYKNAKKEWKYASK